MNTSYTRPELTAEEKAKRESIAYIRGLIKKWAHARRITKNAYRLPHGSAEYLAALAAARIVCEIPATEVYPWNQHCHPSRNHARAFTHDLHLQLAELRGKQHVCVSQKEALAS